MWDFVCGTMSHAKLALHWSVIHSGDFLSDILGLGLRGLSLYYLNPKVQASSRFLW